jgi:hypothetical protein
MKSITPFYILTKLNLKVKNKYNYKFMNILILVAYIDNV